MSNPFSPDGSIPTVVTLILLRHSKKVGGTGADRDSIGIEGLQMARAAGREFKDKGPVFGSVNVTLFHSPMIRTAQTALAFAAGMHQMYHVNEIVYGLGDQEMFDEITSSPAFLEKTSNKVSNLDAMMTSFDLARLSLWTGEAKDAVKSMLNRIHRVPSAINVGVGFFHTPTVELAVSAVGNSYQYGSAISANIPELGGWVIQLREDGSHAIKPYDPSSWHH